jgi:hypothetical protein
LGVPYSGIDPEKGLQMPIGLMRRQQFVPDLDSRPNKPIFREAGFGDESRERFMYRLAHYEVLRDMWLLSEMRRMMDSR